jgi:hypothetical protein
MSSILGQSLRNPAPTPGSIRKGAIPAKNAVSRKRGLPSIGSLQNPSISTSVTEMQTNSTAAAPLFCRPFHKEWEKKYDEGDILFVKAEDVSSNSRNQFHVVANLPVLNYLLRTTRETDNMGNPGKRRYRADRKGLENILSDWHYFGVMLNDMDTSSQFQRLLNVTVRGRCRLPNYWSTDAGRALGNKRLKKGQCVWLGIRKQTLSQAETIGCPDGSRELVQQTNNGTAGQEEYYQMVPVLEENKEFKNCVYRIPIAIVHHLPFKNTPMKRQKNAVFITDQGKLLERMEVFVRI